MFPIDRTNFDRAMADCGIMDLGAATIRQIVGLANRLAEVADDDCVHLEMGNPGLPASEVGINAECEALRRGIANQYPAVGGLPALKYAGEKFLKAFENLDMPARCLVPTVGSMQGCFTTLLLLGQRLKERDTILFINPGFPAQHHQAKILGLKEISFDIYDYRGAALEQKLEECLAGGRVTAILYSNPNNPAWTNLTEEELEILGRMADKRIIIVIEIRHIRHGAPGSFSHPFRSSLSGDSSRYYTTPFS